ncbi:MAG TPA: uroporphyrinogen-III synthase, partial [Polyangia bacterium]
DAALAAAWKAHRARPFDAVAFTSPKGAHAFLALAPNEAAAEALRGVHIGAIGATTRDALLAAGLAVDAVPAVPEVAALVTSLAALAKIE